MSNHSYLKGGFIIAKDNSYRKNMKWLLFRVLIVSPLIVGSTGAFGLGWWWAMIAALLLNCLYWYRYNSKFAISDFSKEIQALVIGFIYYFGTFSIILIVNRYNFYQISIYYPFLIIPYNLSTIAAGGFMFYHNLGWMFIGTFWSSIIGMLIYQLRTKRLPKLSNKKIWTLVGLVLISFLPFYQHFATDLRFTQDYGMSSELSLKQYRPFMKNKQLAQLGSPAKLRITQHYPRLNGATALYPVYSAAAQAVYSGMNANQAKKMIRVDTTPKAFNSLIHNKSDISFMAQPSPAQLTAAKKAHVHLKLTKLGTEAFVFFVNKKNPVNNLTISQIQSIYQRKTIFWSNVGGNFSPIQAFQRAEGSGSQTAMEQQVMKGKKLVKPLRYQSTDGMGFLIDEVAGYNNHSNAIGYSFRFYATQMKQNKKIKVIKVNGIAPTAANIRNGKYPLVGSFYAITRDNPSKNSQRLIDWLTTSQGQQLIDRTGYVGIK